MTWDEELHFANHLADVADEISLRHFRTASVRTKADGSLVTEADEGVERSVRAEVAAAYPDDRILGEEEGGDAAGSGRRWIIDPIDATSNYAWGIPVWATLIGLEVDGEVVAGVVSAPAMGERYEAARGTGARRNGDRIAVSGVGDLSESRLAYTFTAFGFGRDEEFRRLLAGVGTHRGYGDYWGHMLVASGALDVMVDVVVQVWDLAPIMVIVEEAGGRLTDLDGGRRIDGGSALTSNGLVHDAALDVFRGSGGASPGS